MKIIYLKLLILLHKMVILYIIKEPCNAFILSLWNFKKKDSYRIDLWTKEML